MEAILEKTTSKRASEQKDNLICITAFSGSRTGIRKYLFLENTVGKQYGELIIREVYRADGRIRCKCDCSCGRTADVCWNDLLSGRVTSCGHSDRALPGRFRDLTGKRFGKLVAVAPTDKRSSGGSVIWRCRCDCGRELETSSRNLVRGYSTHCGCINNYRGNTRCVDLTGKRFGKLTVIRKSKKRSYKGSVIWECRCDCGGITTASEDQLVFHRKTSCGCRRQECMENAYNALEFVDGTCINWLENRTSRSDNTSGHVGVSFVPDRNIYRAYITLSGTRYNLGQFRNLEEAVAAREKAQNILHGEFIEAYREWEQQEEDWKEQHPFEHRHMSKEELLNAVFGQEQKDIEHTGGKKPKHRQGLEA